jgi:hypothetical protein
MALRTTKITAFKTKLRAISRAAEKAQKAAVNVFGWFHGLLAYHN